MIISIAGASNKFKG